MKPEDFAEVTDGISQRATELYLTDPVFHARTYLAASMTASILERRGVQADKDTMSTVVQAAALALMVAHLPLDQMLNEEGQGKMFAQMLEANLRYDDVVNGIDAETTDTPDLES